jgi:hypothetical protein
LAGEQFLLRGSITGRTYPMFNPLSSPTYTRWAQTVDVEHLEREWKLLPSLPTIETLAVKFAVDAKKPTTDGLLRVAYTSHCPRRRGVWHKNRDLPQELSNLVWAFVPPMHQIDLTMRVHCPCFFKPSHWSLARAVMTGDVEKTLPRHYFSDIAKQHNQQIRHLENFSVVQNVVFQNDIILPFIVRLMLVLAPESDPRPNAACHRRKRKRDLRHEHSI